MHVFLSVHMSISPEINKYIMCAKAKKKGESKRGRDIKVERNNKRVRER